MPVSISGTNGVTFPDSSLQAAAASPYVLKNRIINGDMRIDQRNAGASVTPANFAYLTDRWQFRASQGSKFTAEQTISGVSAPVGFTDYLGMTSTSAYSVGSGEQFGVRQFIEGLNISDLAWGTANASPVTLSFWIRSSLTGTHSGALGNSGDGRAYPFSFTVSSANTWEYKTVTIAGDTSGTWLTTNGIGIKVSFNLGAGSSMLAAAGAWTTGEIVGATGSVSVVGTNGATFYITGVQLEQNTSATPFERRLYNQELANCQRYYVQYFGTSVYEFSPSYLNGFNTTNAYGWIQVPVPMRASPSVSASNFLINDEVAARAGTSLTIYAVGQSNKLVSVLAQAASGITSSRAYNLIANNSTSAYIQISSEL
jgi:hypothetical protein